MADRCQDAKLRDCDDLAEGVVLYAEGERADATVKIKKGLSANEPDQLRDFADKLRLLKNIPGTGPYMGPVVAVADMLSGDDTASAKHEPTGRRNAAKTRDGESAPEASDHAATVVPAAGTDQLCNLLTSVSFDGEPGKAACVHLASGPLTLTDLHTTSTCNNTLLIGAGSPDAPRWVVVVAPSEGAEIHGAAYAVQPGEPLFAAQVAPSGTDLRHDVRCALTWAGR